MMMTILDVILLSYVGDILKQQSTRVGDAVFRCPWHMCGAKFRKSILILLANSAKPLALTGGKFFILDYNKMIGVCIHIPNDFNVSEISY